MSRRSRSWWAAALTIAAAGAVYLLSLAEQSFGFFSYGVFCPGVDLYFSAQYRLWNVESFLPVLWAAGAPAVAFGFAAHWLSTRRDRPRIGRVAARSAAAALLVLYGIGPLAFLADMVIDRGCLSSWGGWEGVRFFLDQTVAPVLAALCMLAAVRRPRHRLRSLARVLTRALRTRRSRRAVAGAAALAVLGLVPVTDFGSGRITTADQCPPTDPSRTRAATDEQVFLCTARRARAFPHLPDHLLLAYGRKQCAAYPNSTEDKAFLALICPPAAADRQREIVAEEAAYLRQEAASQAICNRLRHRPRITPARVARLREFSEIGMESYEDHADTAQEEPVVHGDLVGSVPGHLRIDFHADYEVCVTAEAYRRHPPVEVKGWDKVIEVGYHSPGGDLTLRDPMDAPELPNLAIAGKGHYRVRVHYRAPEGDAFTPQHLLVMVYPGRGDQVIDLKRRGKGDARGRHAAARGTVDELGPG
ncbi:hypothetical protein PS9374_04586 [Planomonospora sphaerica]|uniref:Uncharacterized protein n=1 Tax=Planomonospora sphaerica TaxID=161355 RepID=A0A171DJA6_9ACTN|nr:hypothetical protein [Planomonospora sphaerica]GAT68921.1 hypothetical protein PS9374_04586 [Planomonospora sphaerica]